MMGYVDNTGLTRFWAKCKAAFALIGHTHTAATSSAAGFLSSTDKARLDALVAQGNPTVLLWSGAWGANGASAITVSGINSYNTLIFEFSSGEQATVARDSSIQAHEITANESKIYMYMHILSLSGTTLSVDYTRRWTITLAGVAEGITYTGNRIVKIYGR